MRVRVDPQKCQGHARCNAFAPQLFKLREEDGHSYVEHEVVPPELEDAALKAVASCPEQAIEIEH